jgi:plastocyanin
MRVVHMLVVGGLVTGVACGGSSGPTYGGGGGPSCTPTATQVCMIGLSFSPESLAVPVGTTVTWLNGSSTAHTVTSATGSTEVFNSGNPPAGVAVGATFSHMFATKGTFHYYCQYHGMNGTPPTGMHGTITVQ